MTEHARTDLRSKKDKRHRSPSNSSQTSHSSDTRGRSNAKYGFFPRADGTVVYRPPPGIPAPSGDGARPSGEVARVAEAFRGVRPPPPVTPARQRAPQQQLPVRPGLTRQLPLRQGQSRAPGPRQAHPRQLSQVELARQFQLQQQAVRNPQPLSAPTPTTVPQVQPPTPTETATTQGQAGPGSGFPPLQPSQMGPARNPTIPYCFYPSRCPLPKAA